MTTTGGDGAATATERRQVIGTFGVVIALSVAIILGIHPWGSTDLYDDGAKFVDHVGPFWIAIHFVAAILFLGMPIVIGAWGETLRTAAGQVFGKLAATISIGAVAIAALHLVGTDTTTFLTYEDTLASGQEGALVGADVLLRIHAATLMAFVMALFLAVPLAAAVAVGVDRDRSWRFWLPVAIACLTTAAVCVTLVEGQWTTLSEMGLFRPAATLFLIWFGLVSHELRRVDERAGQSTSTGGHRPEAAPQVG